MFPAGFLLDKKIGVNQPKRLENVTILLANTGMDTDKIKVTAPDQPNGTTGTSRIHRTKHSTTGTDGTMVVWCSGPDNTWGTDGTCVGLDLWLQGPGRLHSQGGGDRDGREGEDEGEGGQDPEARNQLLHQQVPV